MKERTTEHPARTWISGLLDRIDRFAFRDLDLDATARDWQVLRGPRFQRTYRDPRWDTIQECSTCHGSGSDGAHPCPRCEGRGTVRHEPAHLTGAP
jgi:hypothetical protein